MTDTQATPADRFPVGSRVIYTGDAQHLQNKWGTITKDDESDIPYLVDFDGYGSSWTYARFLSATEPSQDETVPRMELVAAQERLATQQANYRHDMCHWESTLRAAKTNQGWCDDGTNAVINDLNEGFVGGWSIEPFESEYTFRLTTTGVMTVTTTVTVTASSQDAAQEMLEEDYSEYLGESEDEVLTAAARNHSFEDVETEISSSAY